MKLFENNFNDLGKKFKGSDKSFSSPMIWNQLLKAYFLNFPSL